MVKRFYIFELFFKFDWLLHQSAGQLPYVVFVQEPGPASFHLGIIISGQLFFGVDSAIIAHQNTLFIYEV